MELYVSGVSVPKLGSIQDVIARKYLVKKAQKDVYLNRLTAQIASGIGAGDSKWLKSITEMWNNYVGLAFYMESEIEQREEHMRAEYDLIKDLKPVMFKDKDGRLKVSGIPGITKEK